ncbi:MAG: type II toxin-antitoxin system RelE/ParE family toxin [Candidatus Undinarchaeales archaeon]
MYKVIVAPAANEVLRKLDKFEEKRIIKALKKLAKRPYTVAKHLTKRDAWSLKVGLSGFRVIFRINENQKQVNVVAIGRRRNIYDKI